MGKLFAVAALTLLMTTAQAVEMEKVAEDFSQPLAVRHAGDGSGRLFVVEQNGVIKVIGADGLTLPVPLLDLSPAGLGLTASGGERGLLGLAFDPDFSNNGFFYVNYTDNPGGEPFNSIVARYSADDDQAIFGSGVIIASIAQDFSNHNGGDLHFGDDGFLYIGMGDGGSGGDPLNRAQNMGSLLGKMMRIDVSTPPNPSVAKCAGTANYAIPPDNPFAGPVGMQGICPEIWASGLRNPYRFSFDRETGDLWIADVGQREIEEIDFALAGDGGHDFGWKCKEGTADFDPDADGCDATPLTDPVMEYGHTGGRCSVTGGYRYRGPLTELTGSYLFGDFCTGEIFLGQQRNSEWAFEVLIDPAIQASDYCPLTPQGRRDCLSGFGEGEDGEVYVVDRGGRLYRFIPDELLFADGFEAIQ